ncbi:hypothetical protein LOD99_8386 [Oopsacas minuta]|uniref:Exocyst subunit Exo70 family protein n=1 Tax=Oopsacas minuta TaxID=111878 RepID=A0AAV7JGA5_9METZ|nr:hypothetical protein LOD99_8386 [Oopsacas minuta]
MNNSAEIQMYHLKFISTNIVERLQKTFNAFKSINILSVLQTDLYSKLQQSLSVAINLTKCEFISKMNTKIQIMLFEGFQQIKQDFTHTASSKRALMRLKLGLYQPVSVVLLNECTSFHFEIVSLIFAFLDNEKIIYKLANLGMSTIVNTIIETLIQFHVIISISSDEAIVSAFHEKAAKWALNQLQAPLHDLMLMIKMSSEYHGNYLFNCEFLCREGVRRINTNMYPELDAGMKLWLIELVNGIKKDINSSPIWAFNEDLNELETAFTNMRKISEKEVEGWIKFAVDSESKVGSYMPRYITEKDRSDFRAKFKNYIKEFKRELLKTKSSGKDGSKQEPKIIEKLEKPIQLLENL